MSRGQIRKAAHAKATAVGYVRVSTEQQADTGVSLEAQAEKIRAMAVVQGVELAEIISDAGASAKSLERDGLRQVLSLVQGGKVQTVIVAKLDRLTRSVKDLAELLETFQRSGVALVSVAESLDTASAAGRLVINIMVSVSQWEREAIGERTATALQHKKRQHRVYGPVPYGFDRHDDALVPNATEQTIITRIQQSRRNGGTLREIADMLNGEGVTTKQGRRWFAQTVKDVLDNTLHVQTVQSAAA